MNATSEAGRAVSEAHRREWALVLAATACVAGDLDLAEECVQEAYASALSSWARDGVPAKPGAWLTTVARRRALDALRRQRTRRARAPLLVEPTATADVAEVGTGEEVDGEGTVPDERLRLIFMCCHPALAQEAQLGLTLRLVCGLPTADIAKVLLVSGPTMSARLTRAKRKIAVARVPFRVPAAAELPDRLRGVLGTVHLLFTLGHAAPSGQDLYRPELLDQALHLCRVLRELMPDEPEVRGLLALVLATDARRATRVGADGRLLRLAEQDRSQWDRAAIAEARALVGDPLLCRRPGRYALQAGVALVHAEAPTYEGTDWPQIVRLYDVLLAEWPSPVVALNRAVALAMASGPEGALAEVVRLEGDGRLDGYPYLYAFKAELLRQLGRGAEALHAEHRALELANNDVEREFLMAQSNQLS